MTTNPLTEGMNRQQARAITAADGPVLVLAGPGSGKTAVLTRRIAWLIREHRVPHFRILAVTFTNKATDQMRSRLEHMLDGNLDDMQIGTFHRISARMLRREAELLGYRPDWKILSSNKQYWVIRRILERVAPKGMSFSPTDVRKAISLAKNRIVVPDIYEATDEFSETVRRAYQIYQEELLDQNLMDVDDLLLQLAILLGEFPSARIRFQQNFECLLIDEFQDTNLVQYEIVKMLAPPQNSIFVVGDEDQSIYGFRGANYLNLESLREDFPTLTQILLEENYRSTQMILDAGKAVIDHNGNRTPKRLYTREGSGTHIQVYEATSEREEAVFVCEQIRRLKASDGFTFADFAVMYRLNRQSFPVRSVLHLHNVPFRVINTIDFDQRREVRDIMALINLAHVSKDLEFLKRTAEIRTFGMSKNGMDKFLDWVASDELDLLEALDKVEYGVSPLNARQARAFADFAILLHSWRSTADRGNLVALLDRIIQDAEYHQHLERICKEDWELAERRNSVSILRDIAKATAETSQPFRELVAVVRATKIGEEDDANKVALTTLHSAKGLEFPVVFIIGLNQDILPHVHETDGPNDVSEERRLLYVGITRAEKQLYLTYARHKGLSDEVLAPSEFLTELPDHLIDLH